MKFPLRLSLDLLRGRVFRAFDSGREAATIHHLSLSEFSQPSEQEIEAESDPGAALMRIPESVLAETSAPVLWLAGEEPLENPVIGRIGAALNAAGRNVFLQTAGTRLRQRIHEFRPDERLFLTLELAGREEVHDQAVGAPGSFRRAMEGIRAAKLSGFHVCAHVTVGATTDPCRVGELFDSLDRYDVDGFMVSSGGKFAAGQTAKDAATIERLEEIRSLVRCSRWEKFSRMLEGSYANRPAARAKVQVGSQNAGACEESA
jgi:MoaA/NifB/PqqE/SkfB family radical SAM enzyme